MNTATQAILARVESGLTTVKDAQELRKSITQLEGAEQFQIDRWTAGYDRVCRERDEALLQLTQARRQLAQVLEAVDVRA